MESEIHCASQSGPRLWPSRGLVARTVTRWRNRNRKARRRQALPIMWMQPAKGATVARPTEQASARLADVARRAGVSKATASRALNGSSRGVREANRLKVLAAADALGYTTNIAAQAVARGRTRGMTLLLKQMPDDYANPIVAGVMTAAEREGLPVTLLSTGPEHEDILSAVNLA